MNATATSRGTPARGVQPVDEVLPVPRLAALGLQHVLGAGLIPLVAPRWSQQMPHALHPLLESGILLTSITAVLLNLYFDGSRGDAGEAVAASKMAEAH